MRLRLGILLASVFASLLSPISQTAQAFGGYASAPTSLTQTAIAGGIRVTWSTPTDVDTGVTGYRVEYSTTGTSGTWTTATTTNSSTFTYDILGLSQVSTYVRVAATTAAGVGTYGYPWETIYSTSALRRDSSGNVSYDSGYGLSTMGSQASNTYASASFTRVKYRMETTISSVARYVETDFYKWSHGGATGSTSLTTQPTISGIAVPSLNAGQRWHVQANVTDLNIFSNHTSVAKALGANGRLEIWPFDYGTTVSGLSTPGNTNTYDSDDTPSTAGSYASFQVHDLTNNKVVFAWNNTGNGNTFSAEVGYGTNTGNNPDWTFCSQGGLNGSCTLPSAFKLLIYINPAITPLADATPPTVTRIDSRLLGKNGDTLTVRSTEIGTVYLVNQSVAVSSLSNITAAAAGNKNSVSISTVNTNTVLTLSGLNDGFYNLYAVDSANNVSTGVLSTIRVDNTAPTASSIAVNSTGNSVVITGSETLTNTLSVNGIYAISDSGSAISVTGVSFSGSTATLSLSRAIPANATVYFTYTPAGGDARGRIKDEAGNELAAIARRTITNNSTSAITVTLSVPDPLSKGVSVTISTTVSVEGRVTFTISGKRINGCFNRSASGTTPITISCTFKPAITARASISATLTPTLSAYPQTSSTVERFILKRTTTR